MWTWILSFFGSGFFSFLKSPKFWIGLAVVVCVFMVYRHEKGLYDRVDELQQQTVKLEAEKKQCVEVNAKNKEAFDELAGKAAELQDRFNKIPKKVEETGKKGKEKVRTILIAPKPLNCQAAIDYLVDAAKERSK